jgi:hypothetical protein
MSSPEYKLPTNNADKSNQIECVTLNLQKFRVGSNISVVDLGHLVNSESLNNYSNISNTKENTLLNNLKYEDNECIVIDNSTTLHQWRNYYGLRPGEPGGPQPQWAKWGPPALGNRAKTLARASDMLQCRFLTIKIL